jgi:hypothetical protein
MFKFTKDDQPLPTDNGYTNWLLEHLCWAASPGAMTLDEFRNHLKSNFKGDKWEKKTP